MDAIFVGLNFAVDFKKREISCARRGGLVRSEDDGAL
jgi:hypothetical protein